MGTVSRVHTFASGAVLTAAQLNTEFDNLLTSSAINGGLNATNLGVTAGQVAASKALVVDSSRDLDDTTSGNMLNNLTLSGTLKLLDDKTLTLGTGSDITVGYDETTTDSLKIAATEAAGLAITLMADEGDDAGDEWKLNIADGGTLTLGNDIASAGTYVTGLTITPHATTASWAMDFEGDVDIGGDTLSFNGAATIDTSGNNALSLDAGSAVLTLDGGTLESDASTLSFDAAATIDTSGNNALTLDAGSAVLTLDGGTLESDATTLSFDAATSIDTSGNNNLTLSAGTATLGVTAGDVTIYDDNNNADTSLSIGTSATEALVVQALNGGSDKTLEELRFTTKTASGTANHGQMSFYVDEVNIGNINDGGITLESGMVLTGNVTGNASGTAATVTGGTQAAITTCTNLVTTGALNSGSITSGFGTINNGSSTITTTGALAAGDTTISGDVTLTSATSAEPILTIKDTNADGNAGYLKFLKDGTSAADDDALGNVVFYGENDAGTPESILYADLYATSTDVSDGTEDGSIVFRTRKDGTLTSTMVMASGNVGIGTASPSQALDVRGNVFLTDNLTDDTVKTGKLITPTYDSQTETEGILAMSIYNGEGEGALSFGGGSGSYNAMTHLVFYAAANDSTRTGTEMMRIKTSGVTKPAQPSFLARGATQSNVTGDGTAYTITFAAAEVFDRGGNFASPTFTAPVTGIYQFGFDIALRGITSSHTSSQMKLVTSNRTYQWSLDLASVVDVGGSGAYDHSHSMLADMDASDTCTLTITVSGGSKVVDVEAATTQTWFYGYLVA